MPYKLCFINKVREEHDQIINQSGPGGARQLITLTSTIRIYIQPTYLCSTTVFQHSVLLLWPYITDSTFSIQRQDLYWEFFVSSVTSAGPRLTPFPPVTAAEHQASLRPHAPAARSPQHRGLTSPPSARLPISSPTIYSSPFKLANLTPKSTPAAKAANRSSKAPNPTIVPHNTRLSSSIGSQRQVCCAYC